MGIVPGYAVIDLSAAYRITPNLSLRASITQSEKRIAQTASAYRQPDRWWRSAVLNTAGVGWFSSDRSIREYDEKIWRTRTRP